jgi:hypothetical protein
MCDITKERASFISFDYLPFMSGRRKVQRDRCKAEVAVRCGWEDSTVARGMLVGFKSGRVTARSSGHPGPRGKAAPAGAVAAGAAGHQQFGDRTRVLGIAGSSPRIPRTPTAPAIGTHRSRHTGVIGTPPRDWWAPGDCRRLPVSRPRTGSSASRPNSRSRSWPSTGAASAPVRQS